VVNLVHRLASLPTAFYVTQQVQTVIPSRGLAWREMKLREEHAKRTIEESMGYGVFLKSEAQRSEELALFCLFP
jgi:hypothetical protein